MIPQIKISEYDYNLPEDRIAKYPLPERDSSKLLIYENGRVKENVFRNISGFLPDNALMVFNDTKVVPARLFFRRQTGALIEVFCLKPEDPVDYSLSFASVGTCTWRCIIGNFRKLKVGEVLYYEIPAGGGHDELAAIGLTARLDSRENKTGTIVFTWGGGMTFSSVLELCGQVPIPPYLNRDTEAIDIERYQTLYAHIRGSVAAPTAGLHFTEEVLKRINDKGIEKANVCLHVGAGTFLPVKTDNVSEHPMHMENIVVSLDFLRKLRSNESKVIAVGTTSVRTLESLYYVGVRCIENGVPSNVDQWEPYTREYSYSLKEALDAIIAYLESNALKELKTDTRIIIVPGFKFRVVDCLVTNFHQPQSTLLLLISAFVGGDWRTIYDYAIENGFRFLSYGDSSLLFRGQQL